MVIKVAIAMHKPTNSEKGDREKRIYEEKGQQISLDDFESSNNSVAYKPKQRRLQDF